MFASRAPDSPIKVIDFGFAARYDPSHGPLHKQLGTFDTMAPEVYGGNYTTQADLWSAGVVAFELISGKKPFAAASQLQVIAKVASGEINLKTQGWRDKSNASKDFVKAIIKKDPTKRMDAERALRHKWLTTIPRNTLEKSIDAHLIGDQMTEYGEAPMLKKIGLLMIAHKTFPEEIVKLQQYFADFDTHGTGVVTLEEFIEALRKVNQEYTDDDIQKIFHSIDANERGEIAYTEFAAAMLEKYVNLTEERILDAFERIDISNSGSISIKDLRLVLGQDFSDEKAKEIIAQCDADGSGEGKHLVFVVCR